jgi:hypothetical protein
MRKKHHSKRTIVVDDVTYTWRYVNHWVEVRHDRAVVFRKPVTEILGVTWDDLVRGERKGYGFPLTPRRVAELIREARA